MKGMWGNRVGDNPVAGASNATNTGGPPFYLESKLIFPATVRVVVFFSLIDCLYFSAPLGDLKYAWKTLGVRDFSVNFYLSVLRYKKSGFPQWDTEA